MRPFLLALLLATSPAIAATCKPDGICKACKDCSACKYCAKDKKGSCSVCRDQDSETTRRRDLKRARRFGR